MSNFAAFLDPHQKQYFTTSLQHYRAKLLHVDYPSSGLNHIKLYKLQSIPWPHPTGQVGTFITFFIFVFIWSRPLSTRHQTRRSNANHVWRYLLHNRTTLEHHIASSMWIRLRDACCNDLICMAGFNRQTIAFFASVPSKQTNLYIYIYGFRVCGDKVVRKSS